MGEIKSAFEKAMEKVEGLGKLSPEEMQQRKEAEYTPAGEALADRFLQHGYLHILQEEWSKYSGGEREIVTGSALSHWADALQLQRWERNERALEGIAALSAANVSALREKLQSLFQEYQQLQEKRYQKEGKEIEQEERDLLHQLRVSGEAVGGINLEASEAWKKRTRELSSQFEQRLNSVKREVKSLAHPTR